MSHSQKTPHLGYKHFTASSGPVTLAPLLFLDDAPLRFFSDRAFGPVDGDTGVVKRELRKLSLCSVNGSRAQTKRSGRFLKEKGGWSRIHPAEGVQTCLKDIC